MQDLFEYPHENIHMRAPEDERRLELEHVVKGSFGAEQDAAALHALDDVVGFPVSGFECVAYLESNRCRGRGPNRGLAR